MYLRSVILGLFLSITILTAQAQTPEYGSDRMEIRTSIHLYPNPAPDYVYIQLGILHADKVSVAVHTVIGNEATTEVEKVDDHQVRVRVKDFNPGYYFITLRDEETKFRGTYKILKR